MFVWPRRVNREYFYSRMLSFYLDEEAFDKELMSWTGVKCNLCKSGMHYILPTKMMKKKSKEVGVGPSSGLELHKKEDLTQSYSEEEEETQPLECKIKSFICYQIKSC
jgi:hypothetical protein